MKRKIFCLLLAALMVVTVFTACKKEEAPEQPAPAPVVCDGHADADKNLACDKCGTPVLTIVEKVPTDETVVNTVIVEVPNNKDFSTIFNGSYESDTMVPTTAHTQNAFYDEGLEIERVYDNTYVITSPAKTTYPDYVEGGELPTPITTYESIRIYNAATATDVVEIMRESLYVTYDVDVIRYDELFPVLFKVTKTETTPSEDPLVLPTVTVTDKYYTLTGELVATSTTLEECDIISYSIVDDQYYVEIGNKVYVIDAEANKVAYTFEKNLFIPRPEFDEVVGNYAYVITGENVLVYDYTKWIECTFRYELPAHYTATYAFVLENGNILVQAIAPVAQSSVNYDLLEEGVKYNIDYILVDVAAKTSTNVEFGYFIQDVDAVSAEDSEYTDTVKNVVSVQEIVNKKLGKERTFYTDNALKILGALDMVLPDAQIVDMYTVATNTYLATLVYGEETYVEQLYNEKGELIATLPNDAVVYERYIISGEKIYDLSMNLLYDVAENGYTIAAAFERYVMLYDSEYNSYFYTVGSVEPRLMSVAAVIDETTGNATLQGIANYSDDYFVIYTTSIVGGESTDSYIIYNEACEVITRTTSNVAEEYEIDGVYTFVLEDGTYYFAK